MTFKESYFKKLHKVELDGKSTYLKKNTIFPGYRVVTPIMKDDGRFDWFNLITGGWANIFKIAIIVALILFVTYSYAHDTAVCRQLIGNQTYFMDQCANIKLSTAIGQPIPANFNITQSVLIH